MLPYLLTFAVGFGLGVGITVILWSACSLSGQTAQPERSIEESTGEPLSANNR